MILVYVNYIHIIVNPVKKYTNKIKQNLISFLNNSLDKYKGTDNYYIVKQDIDNINKI